MQQNNPKLAYSETSCGKPILCFGSVLDRFFNSTQIGVKEAVGVNIAGSFRQLNIFHLRLIFALLVNIGEKSEDPSCLSIIHISVFVAFQEALTTEERMMDGCMWKVNLTLVRCIGSHLTNDPSMFGTLRKVPRRNCRPNQLLDCRLLRRL